MTKSRPFLIIFFVIIGLSSCGSFKESLSQSRINELIDIYFPEDRERRVLSCLMDRHRRDVASCVPDKAALQFKNAKYQNSPSIIQFLWANRHETGLSPEKLSAFIAAGADPEDIVHNVILDSEPEYFAAFVVASGGPNALSESSGYGSIMHQTVSLWDDDKINYLVKLGVDWEQVSLLNGETAVLVARRSATPVSEFDKINRLLDLGANPQALDKSGAGLCDFIANKRSNWDKNGSKRAALEKRLLTEFSMSC